MDRSDWVDRARGIGIVLVVFGHVLRGLANAGMFPGDSPIWSFDYGVYTFHMPLFFLLSGLFVERSLRKGVRPFWRSKFLTVVYPYFLWSLVQGLLLVGFAGMTNNASSPWLRLGSILWLPLAPFWFLYSLFFCHLLFVLLRKLDRRVLLALAVLAYVAGEVYRGGSHDISPVPDTTRGFLFYVLGVMAAERSWPLTALRPGIWASSAIVMIASVVLGLAWSIPYEALWPAALAGIVLLVALAQLDFPAARFVQMLGRYSMVIFVTHIIIASGLRIILLRFTPIQDPALHLLIGLCAGLLLPVVAYRVAAWLGIELWLGWPARPAKAA
jgi:fucose 4-O-acetylase-like acetyltransferase